MVIPRTSLLVGTMTTVWVRAMEGMYEPRIIQTGIHSRTEVEVLEGLTQGELVVSSGAYLLNSAWILKKGAGMGDMKGMKM